MKKVSLLTIASIALFSSMASAQVAGGRMHLNMEDPIYKPTEGMFYSKTNYNYTNVKYADNSNAFTEEFGYGITDKWTISTALGYSWQDKKVNMDEDAGISNWVISGAYRPMDADGFVWDVKAGISIDIADDRIRQYSVNLPIAELGKKDMGVYVSTLVGYELSDVLGIAGEIGYMMDTDDKKDFWKNEAGNTSYFFTRLDGQLELLQDWSINLAWKYQKFIDNDANKAEISNIIAGANWQASDMTLLTLYTDYDASNKKDRLETVGNVLAGGDGDDNRWSFGARVGVQF